MLHKTDWSNLDVYNINDLNRVENNILETLKELQYLCEAATISESNLNRSYADLEFAESLNRIENNILSIKEQFYEPMGWITPKTNWKALDSFSYIDANRLEINIKLLDRLIKKAKENIQYCGVCVCGDDTRIF